MNSFGMSNKMDYSTCDIINSIIFVFVDTDFHLENPDAICIRCSFYGEKNISILLVKKRNVKILLPNAFHSFSQILCEFISPTFCRHDYPIQKVLLDCKASISMCTQINF